MVNDPTPANQLWEPPGMGGGSTIINVDTINNNRGLTNLTTGNGAARTVIKTYVCPSDILPDTDNNGFGKSNYLANIGTDAWGNTNNSAGWGGAALGCNTVPGSAQNGVLLMANSDTMTWTVRISDIKDGASNTLLLGEVTESKNATATVTNLHPFPIWAGGQNDDQECGNNLRRTISTPFRVVGDAYPINRSILDDQSDLTFRSQHPGGAQFVMCDGSVKFVQETIDMTIYKAAATRRGGETGQLP